MTKRRNAVLDPEKFLKPQNIRRNLLLASLYLSGFEIREVNTRFNTREQYGLIPSCKWLQKVGALEESDIDEIRNIRNHRNEVAHELPSLLLAEGFEINLTHFEQIGKLLKKVDTFWARSTLLLDPETLDEVNIHDIRDEDLFSGNMVVLNVIVNTVVSYLEQGRDSVDTEKPV